MGLKGAATYGNYNYKQFQGSITGPITPQLAFRLTGYSTTRDGDVYNVSNGQWVNNLNRNGARAQVLWKPSPDFSLRLIGEYSAEQQSTGALAFLPTIGSQGAALAAKVAAIGGTIITNPHVGMIAKGLVVDPSGAYTAAGGPLETGTRQGAGSAEINWKLGGFTLTSLTAFRYWQYDSRADTESSSADVLYGGYHIQDRQWTQELRLAFPRIGNVDLIAGVYYFNQFVKTDAHTEYGADAPAYLSGQSNATLQTEAALYNSNPAAYAAYASIPAVLGYAGKHVNTYADPLTRSIAAFGQATWHVMPKWNITGGVRVTHETKQENVWSGTTNNDWQVTPGAVFVRISDTAPSWLISSDYHPTPSLMTYFTVSHGEKAGGLNTTQAPGTLPLDQYAVRPETATNYEVGIKGDWFHHKLSATLDVFRMDISNYQANVTQVVPSPSGAGACRSSTPSSARALRGRRAWNLKPPRPRCGG
jgi:iron complex outermembrane receptor protein